MVGVIVYKLLVIHPLYKNPNFQEYAATIVSVTGSLMNLIIIMILSKVRFVFKSTYKPSNPSGRSLSPPSVVWMDYAIPSQGTSKHFNSPVPVFTSGWRDEHKVSCRRTQHNWWARQLNFIRKRPLVFKRSFALKINLSSFFFHAGIWKTSVCAQPLG